MLARILISSLLLTLVGSARAADILVGPPTLPITTGCSGGKALDANSNVLQDAIDSAMPGDRIILAPGDYYFECNVIVDKPLTIEGAGAGTMPEIDGTPRAGGESRVIADSSVAFNGLYGIRVHSSDVVIDGLYFTEEGPGFFRNTIAVLDQFGGFSGTYSNISLLNNYFEGTNFGGRNYQWGGHPTAAAPLTIDGLQLSGNVVKTADGGSGWEPIGLRGGNPWGMDGTVTLTGFVMTDNYFRCSGYFDIALNIQNNLITDDSLVSGNEFAECGVGGVDPYPCPIRTVVHPVHVEDDNIGLDFEDCENLVFPPIDILIDVRPGDDNNAINTRSRQLVPVAVLSTEDFDACVEVDPDSMASRGAGPVGTATRCVDVNDDLIDDLLLKWRANSLEDPTPEECDDPDAQLLVTGSTYAGRALVGSDRVSWRGPACN